MTTSRDIYDEMIRDGIAPALRAVGFRKIRNRFARRVSTSWQIIDFQASQFGSLDEVRFTVNLAVAYFSAGGTAISKPSPDKPPPEHKADVRLRIGSLTPGQQDLWWDVQRGTDVPALAQEVSMLLTSKGLPWLESRGTIDRLVSLVTKDQESLRAGELIFIEKALRNAGEVAAAQLARDLQTRRR